MSIPVVSVVSLVAPDWTVYAVLACAMRVSKPYHGHPKGPEVLIASIPFVGFLLSEAFFAESLGPLGLDAGALGFRGNEQSFSHRAAL